MTSRYKTVVKIRELKPGDIILTTGEIVEKVSRSKLTPVHKVDVWLDKRHALWSKKRLIWVDRPQVD